MANHVQLGLLKQGKVLWIAIAWAFLWVLQVTSSSLAEKADKPPAPWERYKIQLDPEEIIWLQNHPVVRLGFDPEWPPFSFKDASHGWQGIDFDLIAVLQQRLGIRFEPASGSTWTETERKIPGGEVDVVTGISRTEAREKYLLFTSSYVTTTLAVITRDDAPFLTSLHNLKNVTIASPRSYVTTQKLFRDYPATPIAQTATALDALKLVSQGRADVAVENLAVASYLIRSGKLKNLKIAGIADYHFDVCLAVRKDWPELRSILQKTLDAMSDSERRAIFDQWTAVEYFPHTDWSGIWKIGTASFFVALVVFGLFVRWNRRLSRELTERRKVETALQAANQRLQTLNREKDRFTGMVAHDLNNPLTAIIMKCAVFEMAEDFSEKATHDLIATVRNNLQRMNSLIKNLLNADKMEHGRMRLKTERLDLSALARETLDTLQPCAECKNIRLEFADAPVPAWIEADRDATLQVLENLVSNAIKFTPSGKSVRVWVCLRGQLARVEVRDDGPGVSEEDRPRLFGKYVTLSARPTGNEPSNGLGLSIARYLAESMHGAVRYEGKTEEGTLFVVEFALVAPAQSVAD